MPPAAAFWAALLPALVLPFLASWLYFVLVADAGVTRLLYGATKLFTLAWPLLAYRLLLSRQLPRVRLGYRRHLRALPLGLATGLALGGLILVMPATPLGGLLETAAPHIREKAERLGVLEHYWSFTLFLSLVHSLLEEYYWRWFVFGRLRERLALWPAAVAGSLAFSAHHVVILSEYFPVGWAVAMGAAVGMGGVLWCWLYERQGTLAGAWASHLLVDLAVMTAGHAAIG